jgi:hypothetical protein
MENRVDEGAKTGDELAGDKVDGGVDEEDDKQGGLVYGDGWRPGRTS